MLTNKIAHMFVIHLVNTLDDTQLSKKKVLHEALKLVDDMIQDKNYQRVLLGVFQPNSKKHFLPE